MPDFFGDLNDFRADIEGAGLLRNPAWREATVLGHIDIDADGQFVGYAKYSAKERYREELPALPQRTSAPVAAFLSGTPDYWAGSKRKHQLLLHEQVLADVSHPAALSVLTFLRSKRRLNITDTRLTILRIDGTPAHHIPALRAAWERHYEPTSDLNPLVRAMPSEAFIRLGTRSKAASATSYSGNDSALHMLNPGGAAQALNYLLERPATVRHQDTAVIAWMAGDPISDPTPIVLPFFREDDETVQIKPINTLHVAIIDARPPARMGLRWYWSGPADEAFARLDRFDNRLRKTLHHYFDDAQRVRWHEAFYETPRWADMVMAILQSVLEADPMPLGVTAEIVRMHRAPSRLPNELLSAALLGVWANDLERRV